MFNLVRMVHDKQKIWRSQKREAAIMKKYHSSSVNRINLSLQWSATNDGPVIALNTHPRGWHERIIDARFVQQTFLYTPSRRDR